MPTFSGLWTIAPIHSRSLTIDHNQVPSTQTDFPVLVSFTNTTFKTIANGGHVFSPNGYDIQFFSDSGGTTPLKWELERYNASTGEIVFWVKISSVSSASDTVFYMFYGSNTNSDHSDPVNVWTNSFLSVYHLKDGTNLSVSDSRNVNPGTNHGATAGAGQIDGCGSFASASTQYIDCGNAMNPQAVTISAWINGTTFPNAYNGVIVRSVSGANYAFFVKSTGKMAFFAVVSSTQLSVDGTGSHTLSTGTTYYVTMTVNTTSLIGYVNAASDGSAATSGSTLNTTPASTYIGQDPFTAGRTWNGLIDECRIASVARSADWITCEYNNQQSGSTFVTLGTET